MFINGIKYIGVDQKAKAYKFGLSTGRFRNIICFQGLPEEIHRFKSALLYSLTGLTDETILQVILYLSDDNGDHWIIDRSHSRTKIFKNKQELTAGGEQSLRRALLEWSNNDQSGEETPLVELIDLQFIHNEWIGHKIVIGKDNSRDELLLKMQQRITKEMKYLRDFLKVGSATDLETILLFIETAWPAYQQLQSYEQQLKTLSADFALEPAADINELQRLEDELKVIRSLATVAAPLLDPGKSPLIFKERYQKVEQEINEIMTSLGFSELPKFHEDLDWSRLISLLARYQAFERLELAYRKIVARAENSIRPVLEHYIDSMRSFLRQDRKILTELEKSLNLVTQCVSEAEQQEPAPVKKGLRGLLDKLADNRPMASGMPEHKKEEILTHSRDSVNNILCRLGELYSNFELASQKYDEGLDEIFLRHEKIVKELNVTKTMWLKSAKSLNIDPNSSIRNLLRLITEISHLMRLDQERQELRRSIADYRSSLRQVEAQLHNWYSITGSQKTLDLSQPSILLRETKVILSYREQKEKLYEKNQKLRLRLEAFHSVEQRLKSQYIDAERRWKEAFSYLGLLNPESYHKDWQTFFKVGLQVKSLSDLMDRFQSGTKARELLETLSLDIPLTIFHIPRYANGDNRRSLLLSSLEAASPHGHALLLNPDPLLAEAMLKMGIVCAQEVDIIKKNPAKAKSEPSGDAAVLSERARATLELFKSKAQRSF